MTQVTEAEIAYNQATRNMSIPETQRIENGQVSADECAASVSLDNAVKAWRALVAERNSRSSSAR